MADTQAARAYFSSGDGRPELERIFDAGYISQAAYDELFDEVDWYGSIQEHVDLDVGGLLDLPDDLVRGVFAEAEVRL